MPALVLDHFGIAVVALSWGTAGAADKSKVDRATKQVERGAKQIDQGQVGGANFSGENIKEFFSGKK